MTNMNSRLNELAEKSANKNGSPTYNLSACQALRNDLFEYLKSKFDDLTTEIKDTKMELLKCQEKLDTAHAREAMSHNQVQKLQNQLSDKVSDKEKEILLIGSSILREVRDTDIENGQVQSISGGTIKDIKPKIENLKYAPKTVLTLVGGNDLEMNDKCVEDACAEYSVLVTDIKAKFPDTNVVIAGLPPRFKNNETRTKVKDFNESTKKWCAENEIKFIENESPFELRNGEVDESVFVMTGEHPAVHLTRKGTIRLLENLKKSEASLNLSSNMNTSPLPKDGNQIPRKSYAPAVSKSNNQKLKYPNSGSDRYIQEGNYQKVQRGCFNCGEHNHVVSKCKFSQKIRCRKCNFLGHKEKHCWTKQEY